PGAFVAPPLIMRHLLLLAENYQQDASRLRVFDVSREDQKPVEIARQIVAGHVRETPVLRGKELFVPSTPQRVPALRVWETGDENSLVAIASFQVKSSSGAPVYLSTGPDDQMWMYSTALRRFELTPDSLLPAKQQLVQGLASQALQGLGDSLFVGR